MARPLHCDDYTVGWVCALPVELVAAQEMLDEEHDTPPYTTHDTNLYTCGRVGEHNVVIACLPEGQMGTNSAAAVAVQMKSTFSSTRFGLMVGIGGGVPSEEADVRLGDVVVSKPHKTHGGVVQYDLGKATASGFDRTGALNTPPTVLLNAVANVRAKQMRGRGRLLEYLSKLDRLSDFSREAAGADTLFEAEYDHVGGATCMKCSTEHTVAREARRQEVVVHYGTIASGNQVIRSATERDKVSTELGGVLCFEMEAAGLMNSFPCLVVRGVCDYADSHKNKRWQPYAAATAAAYAKEVLSVIPSADVAKSPTAEEMIRDASVKPTYYIPFLKNHLFVGRRNELTMLRQRLLVDQDCQKMSIVGLGGTGKTQIALHFAYDVKAAQPEWSIFWVPAVSMESFEQACAEIVRALHIPMRGNKEDDAKELVKQYLSSGRVKSWLLVVDNADDPDILFGSEQSAGIVDYLPESESGVVVYTTRTLEVAVSLTRGDALELEAMDRQDAREFLSKSLVRKELLRDEMADKLLDELTCLPLAIAQAAAYLNMNRMTIARYLWLLHNTEQDLVHLMSEEFRDETRYKNSKNAVATTWVVSFSQLRSRDAVAADLLEFMSYVECKAIPRSLLPRVQSEARLEKAIGTLCGYSFLARRDSYTQATSGGSKQGGDVDQVMETENWYDIHRLVHLATRIWVRKYGDPSKVVKDAWRHVAAVFPSYDYKNRAVWRAYLPHVLRLLESCEGYDAEEMAKLFLRVGRCLRVDGRTKEAVVWFEKSGQHRSQRSEEHSNRLLPQHVLAMAYEAEGQMAKKAKLLENMVEMKEALARVYHAQVQVAKAVVKAREFLAANDPNRLALQHALAMAYQADGQMKKALELLESEVKMQETLATDPPNRLVSQDTLATVYQADGQTQAVIKLLERMVAVEADSLRDDHPSRLVSVKALAAMYAASTVKSNQASSSSSLQSPIMADTRFHGDDSTKSDDDMKNKPLATDRRQPRQISAKTNSDEDSEGRPSMLGNKRRRVWDIRLLLSAHYTSSPSTTTYETITGPRHAEEALALQTLDDVAPTRRSSSRLLQPSSSSTVGAANTEVPNGCGEEEV